MTELVLRSYQREAIDAVFKAWSDGMKAPAIVLPTGAGKTVVFSALIKRWTDGYNADDGYRVIVLAHRDELVDQAIAKLRAVLPNTVSVGKVKAEDNDVSADVMVCSVQTLTGQRRLLELLGAQATHGKVGLIITDECHHAAAASYKKIYAAFPDALRLGVTATMARGDKTGLGDVWDAVVYKRSILNLISKGHLTDVRTRQVKVSDLKLDGVKTSKGDYQAGDLGDALIESGALAAIPRAYREHAEGKQGIVFTPTVAAAEVVHGELNAAGVRTAVISGTTPPATRKEIYEDFRTGKVQVLSNCMVLTEGFDAPWAEVAVIARPTQSAPLYTQMVGRVLRPWPGKKEALVLDLVGASANKLKTLIDLEPEAAKYVRDGESLAEAVIREDAEQNTTVPAGSIAFELKVREVSSFDASEHAWQRTPKGVMFINCGSVRVVLWPSSVMTGLWDVVVAPKQGKWERTSHSGLELSMAMAWGEAHAEDYAEFSPMKTASWRKGKPSQAQLDYADTLGIDPAGMSKGQLSEAIDYIVSARALDRYVKA